MQLYVQLKKSYCNLRFDGSLGSGGFFFLLPWKGAGHIAIFRRADIVTERLNSTDAKVLVT